MGAMLASRILLRRVEFLEQFVNGDNLAKRFKCTINVRETEKTLGINQR